MMIPKGLLTWMVIASIAIAGCIGLSTAGDDVSGYKSSADWRSPGAEQTAPDLAPR